MSDPLSVFRLHVRSRACIWLPLASAGRFCLSFLRYAKLGAACASVALDFFGRRQNRLPGDDVEYRLLPAHARRQIRRARASVRELGERFLDDAVLKRVVADDHQRPPGLSQRMAASRPLLSTSSSPFTSMRSAWNVRFAGCPPARRAEAGMAALMMSTSCSLVSMGAFWRARTAKSAIRLAHFSSE